MPTTRSRGLSTADLDTLRTAVEAGRKPKVQFTSAAGQVAGQIGQVVRFDDPSADEWVVVRFGRDELPFAPGDLQLAPKAPPRQKAVPKQAAAKATADGAGSEGTATPGAVAGGPFGNAASGGTEALGSASGGAGTGSARSEGVGSPAAVAAATSTTTRPVTAAAAAAEAAAAVEKPSGKAGSTRATAPATETARTGGRPTASTPADAADAARAGAATAAGATKSRSARKSSGKRAPDLTVTLAHHEGHWTVSAARGARVLVKPTSVRAADALRMVGQLESPAVADAVEEIVSAARAEAEEQAERLRQQLAEVEAALADLTDPE